MPASPPAAPPAAEQGIPAIRRVLAAAAAGDGAAAAAAARPLAHAPCRPEAVVEIIGAALDLDHAGFIEAAAAIAIAAELPVGRRIHVAWRLALAGKGEPAMAVLLSDPRIAIETTLLKQIVVTLQEVQARSAPQALARHQARALARRLLPVAPPPDTLADRHFSGNRAARPQPRGAAVTLHAAPLLPDLLRAETAGALAAFDEQLPATPFPEIRLYRDVFVNRLGQIWDRAGTVYRSFSTPIPPASRQAEADAPTVPAAVLAVETHNNVYHWLAEWYPSLAWRLDAAADEMPVLLRDDAARFVRESLTLGAAGALPLVLAGDAVLVRELHVADRDIRHRARHDATGALMDRLRARAEKQAGAAGRQGRSLYISRRDSLKRPMANEAALEEALARRGFEIAIMSPLPFAEQIALVSGAETIVAPHGAGLALLSAARPGRRVVEIVPAMRGGMALRSCMARLSRMVGHEHHLWLEPEPATGGEWALALDAFLAMLDALPAMAASAPHSPGIET